MKKIEQHQEEIQSNWRSWQRKPLLQSIYNSFYERILLWIDPMAPGNIVEVGSGIGNLKSRIKTSICTDLFPNPWLDLVCDGYELPFAAGSVSHLLLFDVFHHLENPGAFLESARRVMTANGRMILFEPYISAFSHAVYGMMHPEPVSMRKPIFSGLVASKPRAYYAAQGNATRIFFRREHPKLWRNWHLMHAEAFSTLSYFLSGGYSRPALFPARWLGMMQRLDRRLSRFPRVFAGRCLVVLEAMPSE